MKIDEAIEIVVEFIEDLRMSDVPIYNNEEEALEILIKVAK